jgi:hypothetical protein
MKLVMTLLVRNEEDILRDNLEFHLSQGVDFFVCTDNLSEDGTRDILDEYRRLGVLEWRREESDDYSQHAWVTRMARAAVDEHCADWVVNNDADEFWMATSGSLKERLASQAPEVLAIECRRYNFPEIVDCDHALPFYRRMLFRDLHSVNALGHPLPGKVCHRGLEEVVVAQGNQRRVRQTGTGGRSGHARHRDPAFPRSLLPAVRAEDRAGRGCVWTEHTVGSSRWRHLEVTLCRLAGWQVEGQA